METTFDRAQIAQRYFEEEFLTNGDVAAKLHCSKRYVQRLRETMRADVAVLRMLHDGQISATVVRAVGKASRDQQPRLAEIAAEHRLSAVDVRELVKHMKSTETDPDEAASMLGMLIPTTEGSMKTKSPGAIRERLGIIFSDYDQSTLRAVAAATSKRGATGRSAEAAGLIVVGEHEPFPPTMDAIERASAAIEMAISVEYKSIVGMALRAARLRATIRDAIKAEGDDIPEPCRFMFQSLGKMYAQLGEAGGLNPVEARKQPLEVQ